ncbi:MAG: hypothetical protein JWO96_263 [Candidatus Saccharibacteria bacterium]|nr:hypothetical protein [Candidatus Saccharibacteria bacterium]
MVESIIVVAVIGAICGAGWFVYDHRKTADSIYKGSPNPGAVLATPNNKNVTAKKTKISEFGIQFTAPVTLKDLTYKILTVDYSGSGINTLGAYPTAFFSTKELDSAEGGMCSIKSASSNSVAPLGYLTRATGQYSTDTAPTNGSIVTYPANPDRSNPTGTLIKQFPEFYLAYRTAGQGCFNLSANNEKALNLGGQLSAALKTATAAQ